ncbi:hypothetical protein VI817_005503 [Penicillium citrinum]|nr:hypothetical protein VI817_005503 [Penicillium citrinum]
MSTKFAPWKKDTEELGGWANHAGDVPEDKWSERARWPDLDTGRAGLGRCGQGQYNTGGSGRGLNGERFEQITASAGAPSGNASDQSGKRGTGRRSALGGAAKWTWAVQSNLV